MARVWNSKALSTTSATLFTASTDGIGLLSFKVRAISGIYKIYAEPLVPRSYAGTTLSGVIISAANADNNTWAPVANVNGPFTSVIAVGIANGTLAFRPEMGDR